MKITIVRWMLLISFVLCFGCGEGMNVKGEGSLDDDATDDDVIPSEPPPPPVNCDWARGNEAIILMWQHQDLNMVDSFIIERWERELSQWKIIAEPKPNPEVVIQQYTDESALCDVSYTYRIYASNSAGKSKKSCAVGNAIWNCPNR